LARRSRSYVPRLEQLEDRIVPSVLVIDDQSNSGPAAWLITAGSVTETLPVGAPTILQTTGFTGVEIDAGTGGNIFNIQSTVIPVTINSQGPDAVILGNVQDGMQDIAGDLTLDDRMMQFQIVNADDSAPGSMACSLYRRPPIRLVSRPSAPVILYEEEPKMTITNRLTYDHDC
jgi:hypothetical protein